MKKRILSVLLAAITVLAILPLWTVTAFAEETETVDSVEFELEGYALGENITDVNVKAVGNAVNINGGYGEGFMIFDHKFNLFTGEKFAKNTIYVLGVRFSAKDGSEITIDENDVESVTLNGLCASMIGYDRSEKIYTAVFYLPAIDREGTPIDAVSLDLALFGYGKTVSEVRLYKEDPEDVRYEVALMGTYNAEGEKLKGSDVLDYGMHRIEIYLIANGEYHFESLTVEDVTLNGVNASSISYITLSDSYVAVLRFDICIHEFDNHLAEEYYHWWECDCGEIYEKGYEDHYDDDGDGCCDECYFDMPLFIPPEFPNLTVESVEIYIDREIAPVTGGDVIWDDEAFTVAKINGEDAPEGILNGFDIYWLFYDKFGYNDNYIDYEADTFAGGFYYCLDLDVYLFAPYAETVEITLKTPTQTYVAEVFSGEAYAYAYFSFDKTEGEQLKKYGDTVVTLDGFEVGAKAGDITVTVVGEGVDYIGEYLAGYAILDIVADDYLGEDDVIEAGKLYALELYLFGKEGYCIIDFSQEYENVTLNGFSPYRAYYEKNDEEEFVFTQFALPMLGEGLKKVTAPTMSLNGYELGCDIFDLLLNFESEGLSVLPEYDEDYWAWEASGNGDDTVNSCESFEFVIYMRLNDGYTSDGITKDMLILNGSVPYAIYNNVAHFGDGTFEPNVIAVYELPVFHEYDTEWIDGEEEHWNECACGEKTNVAPHLDDNDDGECDICGSGMATAPETDGPDNPNNTPDDPSEGNDGLGAGAIVGIVIGSVAVVGIGGFAIFWFVIKKKSFAELIAVFGKR